MSQISLPFLLDAIAEPTGSANELGRFNNDDVNTQLLANQLNKKSSTLFSPEPEALVDLLDREKKHAVFEPSRLHGVAALDARLKKPTQDSGPGPQCRYVFIHARNSREPLKTSRVMFLKLLAYHQITPGFLGFVFPFGRQFEVQFHLCGLRDSSRLHPLDRGLAIPDLGRSGRNIELCYSLKSAEVARDPDLPWSIRQCSVYHSYDLETANCTWMTVKGNDSMRQLIEARACGQDSHFQRLFSSDHGAFKVTLATHSAICSWAVHGWHWYINHLESSLQDMTRSTLSQDVNHHVPLPKEATFSTRATSVRSKRFSRQISWLTQGSAALKRSWFPSRSTNDASGGACVAEPSEIDDSDTSELESTTEREFSFEHLQDVHFTEEKVDEALEVVRANVNVFERLGDSYRALQESPHCPRKLLDACQSDLDQFYRKLNNLCSELKQQENRLCALVKLFASRRSLLHEILQYRNVQANNLMAERAQVTALRMEGMTKEMHTIAQKTKVETVSMRIITLVTLFFLPGTFISTLMSTPIVTFEPGSAQLKDRVIAVGALQFFVLVSLPLVLLTFVAWYLVYRRENRKEAARCKSFSDDLEKGKLSSG